VRRREELSMEFRFRSDGMVLAVDCDGTTLSGRADRYFRQLCDEIGNAAAVERFLKECPDDLRVNWGLVRWLSAKKAEGWTLVLWTNRSEELRERTLRNLGSVAELFSAFLFRGGEKGGDVIHGVVVDNEARYLACGTDGGVLIDESWEK
jgi:hypothetical protein